MTFNLFSCVFNSSQKKKNRCAVLASLDREDEEPYYAWAWKGSNHPSVPGEDTKLTVMRLVMCDVNLICISVSADIVNKQTNSAN